MSSSDEKVLVSGSLDVYNVLEKIQFIPLYIVMRRLCLSEFGGY